MEILSAGLLALAVVLAYLLYRQQQLTAAAQQTLLERDEAIQTLQQDITRLIASLEEKKGEITRLEALMLTLRQTIAEQESSLAEQRKQLSDYQSVVASLRGQIETSEEASLESQALFQTISRVAYDLVLVLNEERIVIALNQAADVLFGGKHPIGEKLAEVLDAPELLEIIDRAMTGQEGLEEQIVLGRCFYRVRPQVFEYHKTHKFIGIALQDITQLVKLNRARRDMVANISHELRTPIQNIRLTIDSLFYDKGRPKRKASIASLRSIARETDALLWLVQELYDLSMIESGQAILKLVPVRLLDVVNDSVSRLKDQFDAKQLKIVLHIPEKLVVLCDYEQTRRVLMNLLHNAMKWSPVGEAVTVSASGNGEEVTIQVFDNGPGVPEDQRERIFERFYQVDSSRSKKEGTGLGLAICKHIVEAHGGQIRAEGNATGSGGRFIFTLLDGGTDTPVDIPAVPAGQHDSGLNMLIASRYPARNGHEDEGEIELEE